MVADDEGPGENISNLARAHKQIYKDEQIVPEVLAPLKIYQEYSREPIVFFKNLGIGGYGD